MKSSGFIFLCVSVVACGTSGSPPSQSTSGGASGAAGQSSGASTGGTNPSSGSTSGAASGLSTSGTVSASGAGSGSASGAASGATSGVASGASSGAASGTTSGAASGASSGVASGSSGGGASAGIFDAGLPPGSVNMVPAGYKGAPFMTNVIPGFLYVANYDTGGPAVAYCHTATGTTPTACAGGIKLTDWCCSDCNAQMTGARCDDRSQSLGVCPVYRPDSDNAGLSHMNLGEVDTYAVAGPTWIPGANGPTLTGPTVTVGTPVPQHANMTTADDTYLSYTNSGEWQKYTVEVLSAGTYSIGALMGTPPNVTITLDFGISVTPVMLAMLPASPVSAACMCAEAYHAWNPVGSLGTVTFAAAGTYLLTLTLNAGNYNPLYFTFTKM
jgi:hypothetical protein